MIDPVIFSKDRPAQLDLLLTSLEENGDDIFHEPVVIYRASNSKFDDGYERCFDLHTCCVPVRDDIFYHVTMNAVYECLEFFCFMVDDQIMWRKPGFDHKEVKWAMKQYPKAACMSLRLGYNTYWQYQTQRRIREPNFQNAKPFLLWNRNTCPQFTNYGYPLSVDAHIFRRDEILPLMEQIYFDQPNQLEARLQAFVPKVGKLMLCPNHSVLVNAAVNRVQDIFQNKVGNKEQYKADVLNTRFLGGDRLSLDKTVKDLEVIGCHQEIDLQWENEDV